MSENPNPAPDPTPEPEQTFTKADLDVAVEKIAGKIRAEERRKVSEKYADYDDLRTKAGTAETLEQRVAEIERNATAAEERALRAEVANSKGLTPSQAKRLVGGTKEELEADADELLRDIGATQKKTHVVPGEGKTPTTASGDADRRAFVRQLTGRD